MSIEATAEALAPDTAMPVSAPVTENMEAAEVSEDSAMEALFDSMNEGDEDQTADEQTAEAPKVAGDIEEPAEPEAEQAEQVAAPSDIPYALKQHWQEIPESAREAILDSQRDMGRKLADQGRQVQGIAPIRDVLTKAVQEIPSMADMRPEDAAAEIFELAKLSHEFTAKPVETLMGYIQKQGLGAAMHAALSGQDPTQAQQAPQLMKHIQGLERKIAQLADPEAMRSSFETFTEQSQVQNSVTEFASKAEHWAAVEDHMPATIQYMQATLGKDASTTDVLTKAYDLAVSQNVPDAKAKQQEPLEKTVPAVDPERSKAALKAKSANVQSRASGKFRTMTEDELMSAAYDKMQN